MFLDNIDNALIELVLEREIDTFFNMRDDDQRAHGRSEIIVWIALEAHVFSKIFRLNQLADIVKIRADAAKRGVRADGFGGCLSEIGDDQTVMIGARCFNRHPAEQRMRSEERRVGE